MSPTSKNEKKNKEIWIHRCETDKILVKKACLEEGFETTYLRFDERNFKNTWMNLEEEEKYGLPSL